MNDFNQEEILAFLNKAEVKVEGQFMWGSNYTFLVDLIREVKSAKAVYKPVRGERELWDFPAETLSAREVAAYHVSEALGLGMVPPTVFRQTAPVGPGSLQLFIDHNPDYHFFNFTEEDHDRMFDVAVFDLIINNADRKGGHIIKDEQGGLWLIDHGVCFHKEYKLRTVIWDFAGQQLPEDPLEKIDNFLQALRPDQALYQELLSLISEEEIRAMQIRTEELLQAGHLPHPDEDRRPYPWPLV